MTQQQRREASFEYHRPSSLAEASSLLIEGGDRVALLAGGTDLVVRLKRGLRRADLVVDLGGLDELSGIEERVDGLWLGAMARPWDLATHPALRQRFAAVAESAAVVGAMQVRSMATLGGALCGGLRCQLRDQSRFWRRTLGACLQDGGDRCHASATGRCLATVAADLPPALVAAGAEVELRGPEGRRTMPAERLYTGDGLRPLTLEPGELITGALLPWSVRAPRRLSSYRKTALRRSIDRPLVGLAAAVELSTSAEIEVLRIALCGDGPAVQLVDGLEGFVGAQLTPEVAASVGRQVAARFVPTPALRVDRAWRRTMATVMARRALGELAERARLGTSWTNDEHDLDQQEGL